MPLTKDSELVLILPTQKGNREKISIDVEKLLMIWQLFLCRNFISFYSILLWD